MARARAGRLEHNNDTVGPLIQRLDFRARSATSGDRTPGMPPCRHTP
jgi:hypothetical protein